MKFLHRNFSGKVVHCNDLTASLTVKFLSEFSKFSICIISGPDWIPKWNHLSLSSCEVSWKGIRFIFTQQFGKYTPPGAEKVLFSNKTQERDRGWKKCHPPASNSFKSWSCSSLLFPLLSALKIVLTLSWVLRDIRKGWDGEQIEMTDHHPVYGGT